MIVIRPFRDTDSGLIYASYAKGVYHGQGRDEADKPHWFQAFHTLVQHQIQNCTIYMACDSEDPDHTLGYSIVQNGELQFVYVKPLYRQQGIGRLLTNGKYETINQQHMTKLGQLFMGEPNENK